MLFKYESLFDSTLGAWKIDPVKLNLKDNAKLFHSHLY